MSLYDGYTTDPKAATLRAAGWIECAATDPANAYWNDPLHLEREVSIDDAVVLQHDREMFAHNLLSGIAG